MRRCLRHKGAGMMNKSIILKSVGVVCRAAPACVLCYAVTSLLYGLSFGFLTLLKQILFDSVAQDVVIGKRMDAAILPLILFALGTLANQILNGLSNFLYHPFMADVSKHLTF